MLHNEIKDSFTWSFYELFDNFITKIYSTLEVNQIFQKSYSSKQIMFASVNNFFGLKIKKKECYSLQFCYSFLLFID